ncbi:hypothetical protein [Desulfobacca acetoxidans]
MADKEILFSDKDQQKIEAIVIDRDKDEALRFLNKLLEWIKGHPGRVCGPAPIQ